MLCAENASEHYLVKMYMTGVKIVLYMHNMKKNINHIRYHLQVYQSDIENVVNKQCSTPLKSLNVISNTYVTPLNKKMHCL